MQKEEQYLTSTEVAEDLGICRGTVFRWIRDGKIPAIKMGRNFRIPLDAYQKIRASLVHFEDTPSPALVGLIDDWGRFLALGAKPLSPQTVRGYRYYLQQYLKLAGGASKPQEIASRDRLASVLETIPVASYSNRYNLFYSVISFTKFLVWKKLLSPEILEELKPLRPRRYFPARKTVMEVDEIERFINAIWTANGNSPYERKLNFAIVKCFLLTGLRNQELCDLTLADVDLRRRQIVVRLGKGAKTRYLGINQELARVLDEYLKIRPSTLSSSFFVTEQGNKLTPGLVSRRIRRLSLASGIDITPHGLRRSWVTQAALKGHPIAVISKAAGHTQLSTTQGYLMVNERQVIQQMQGW